MKASTSALILVILSVASLAEKLEEQQNSSSESFGLDKLSSKAENVLSVIQDLVSVGYSEDKLGTISGIIKALKDDADSVKANVTLVGTQNIYDADGSIKEIRTIELSMPNLQSKSLIDADDDDDSFDISDNEKMQKARELEQDLSKMGINVEMAYQELDKLGNVEEAVFIAENILADQADGMYYINKTIEVKDENEVDYDDGKLTSHLLYDKEGKFMKERSYVVPFVFASVESDSGSPSAPVIHTTLKSLVNAFLESENRDDVPETLRQTLQTHYPGVLFTVTKGEPDGAYISNDFSIHLNYNMVEYEDVISYSVYGYNQTTSDSS